MKKSIQKMAVTMMLGVCTPTLFSSCSPSDIVNDIVDAVDKGLDTALENSVVVNPWKASEEPANAQERYWKYLKLDSENKFILVEVQKNEKFITRGSWEVSQEGKVYTLKATEGALNGSILVMNMQETTWTQIVFTIGDVTHTMIGCKTEEIENFINSSSETTASSR